MKFVLKGCTVKLKCNLMHLADTKFFSRFCIKNKSDAYSKFLIKYLETKTIDWFLLKILES